MAEWCPKCNKYHDMTTADICPQAGPMIPPMIDVAADRERLLGLVRELRDTVKLRVRYGDARDIEITNLLARAESLLAGQGQEPQEGTPPDALVEAVTELQRARVKHAPMHGPHEGYAVILEELEELWAEVKAQSHDKQVMRKEAIQIAAMALRFVEDVCDAALRPERKGG